MNKLIALMCIALMAGCTSKTEYGDCIGALDEAKPGLNYKMSFRNTMLALIFSETVIVPAVVLVKESRCPVSSKLQQRGEE